MGWGKLEGAELLPSSAVCFQEVTKLSKATTAETAFVAAVYVPSFWGDPHLKEEMSQLRLVPSSQGLWAAQEMILLELPSKGD